jgi:hypothetical protein
MTSQETQERDEFESQVREAGDIPDDERAKEGSDDEGAERRSLELESVRPWRVAKSLDALLKQVNTRSPGRSKASDGSIGDAAHASRSSDHNPWIIEGGVGIVTARDITHDPANGCDAGVLAEAIRASRDPRVKYIIWNRRIANSSSIGAQPAWEWRPYGGTNPHNHHCHISVKSDKASYDSIDGWTI